MMNDTTTTDAGDDIRLLGRLIGDVLREQSGEQTFDLVERVRRIAVDERRAGANPIDLLNDTLVGADIEEQLQVIRAFGWLSLLANTAEDLHQERRRRHHRDSGSGAQQGSLPAALTQLVASGVSRDRVLAELSELTVSPVITAHPTEVRRKTVLDRDRRGSRRCSTVGPDRAPVRASWPTWTTSSGLEVADAVADGRVRGSRSCASATRSTRHSGTTGRALRHRPGDPTRTRAAGGGATR